MSAMNLKPPSPKGLTVPGTPTKVTVPMSSPSLMVPKPVSVPSISSAPTTDDTPPWEENPKPIDWAKGDSLDDVPAFKPQYVLVEDEDAELAEALLMYDRMQEGKKRLGPKVLAQGSVRELKAVLAYTKKAGPHPLLQDAEVHVRLALELYNDFLKTLEVV